MKTHKNRSVREDCARYLRCVLEMWPVAGISNINIDIVNSRKEERLSLDSTRQIGLALGRTLSDSAKPVREEAKKGFVVLFHRFRAVWDEVMSSGVIRDVRLRKKLLEAAGIENSDGKLFDDTTSLGDMSLNSAMSGLSYASHRSAFSNRSYASRGVPSVVGTPKGVASTHNRSRIRYGPSGTPLKGSPTYMAGTASPTAGNLEQSKVHNKAGSSQYSANQYVTSSGHVLSTPGRRSAHGIKSTAVYPQGDADFTQQPFASVLRTPNQAPNQPTPESKPKSAKVLRKRLSHRISGVYVASGEISISPDRQLSSIDESRVKSASSSSDELHLNEISNVALEVIAAHLSHMEKMEFLLQKERDVLLDINKQLGISISDATQTAELVAKLGSLSEEKVCDYFESVYQCANDQKRAGENLIEAMERVSQGDAVPREPIREVEETNIGNIYLSENVGGAASDVPQSPLPVSLTSLAAGGFEGQVLFTTSEG